MKKLIILLVMLPLLSFAQKEKKVRPRQQAKIKATANIQQLKKSVLLVRLSEKKNTINAMKKVGKDKLAAKTKHKQREKNKKIIAAFLSNFDFCPVYFFFSDDSKYIRNKQLDSVIFLNENLEHDTSIKVNTRTFFTAELGVTEPDTTNYSSETYFDKGKKSTTYYGAGEISLSALIIKDDQIYQLGKPFPYYVREYAGLPFQARIAKMVRKMNQKLISFYKKNQ